MEIQLSVFQRRKSNGHDFCDHAINKAQQTPEIPQKLKCWHL